ncbi:hypothetical protein HELRODRAFT_164165 [Helobdella robusta]|uniref:CUB domain-containing protein n=1 Tax=Helobdella robusta TaxID=6412 RepID=T1EV11_HELRO|nr:hypothetical protein HELRODRAFT_164165 [Helobdella robusta]ESN94339.1 hypothetical protein HELRODRAFT_164165 [Helobdella robusta]
MDELSWCVGVPGLGFFQPGILNLLNIFLEDCDVTVNSSLSITSSKNGTISSPNFPFPYFPNLRCIYRFIGLPTERVRIEFKEFEVKGVPPSCLQDYIDIYTQVEKPFQDLLDIPLHGRFCGSGLDLLPNILISMHNALIIGFYTDHIKEEKGFLAEYSFIDDSLYLVGTPAPFNQCGQTIYGTSKPSGFIYSPTYPGVYPDNVFCFYHLAGIQRQRIKLTFLEIDLYSGGDHCPYDYILIYDGPTNNSEIINTFCGHRNNVTLFSSSSNLYIEFSTKSGRLESTKRTYLHPWESSKSDDVIVQRRGFKAFYEISGAFVDLECDQMVLSTKESNGVIKSPNFPYNFPLKIRCNYYIDGLEDKQNLEKAKIEFDYLNIPKVRDGCNNGHLKVYLKGQIDKPDDILCGTTTPSPLTSSNPRLLLTFDTIDANYAGKGFKAKIQFLTDFAIPGTPATDGLKCHFIYKSTSSNQGAFNSPRHPSNYPDDSACIYEFISAKAEQIRITFETFKLENDTKWVLKSALNFASDGEVVREVGREFQRKGPEKAKADLAKECLTRVTSAREQGMEIYEKRKGHEQLDEQQS